MAERKLIAVCGATGKQGGSVVDALRARGGDAFAIRAVARDAAAPKARALADKRRADEVVAADFDDEASLSKAFEGAYGAFLVTNYWRVRSMRKKSASRRDRCLLRRGFWGCVFGAHAFCGCTGCVALCARDVTRCHAAQQQQR
jgi:NAD(P)-dependent dehydrogenase (short-subunit alcohol dehydrogenase family)